MKAEPDTPSVPWAAPVSATTDNGSFSTSVSLPRRADRVSVPESSAIDSVSGWAVGRALTGATVTETVAVLVPPA